MIVHTSSRELSLFLDPRLLHRRAGTTVPGWLLVRNMSECLVLCAVCRSLANCWPRRCSLFKPLAHRGQCLLISNTTRTYASTYAHCIFVVRICTHVVTTDPLMIVLCRVHPTAPDCAMHTNAPTRRLFNERPLLQPFFALVTVHHAFVGSSREWMAEEQRNQKMKRSIGKAALNVVLVERGCARVGIRYQSETKRVRCSRLCNIRHISGQKRQPARRS